MRTRVKDAVRISEAFEELSPAAFAAWIRLNDQGDPRPGRTELAKVLRCSPNRADQLAAELARVGYVELGKRRGRLVVKLAKRALVAGGLFFVLGGDRVTTEPKPDPAPEPELFPEKVEAGKRKIQTIDTSKMDGQRKGRRARKPEASKPKPAAPKPKPAASSVKFPGFNPSEKELRGLLAILARPASDAQRKALEHEIGESFGHTYRLYRLRVAKQRFELVEKDRAIAAAAGALCLQKGVAPEALIEYWAENVGRFTSMKFPSLAFLSSPKNVDEAACNAGGAMKSKVDAKVHSFTDEAGLDPRLRPGLAEAGFDLDGKNDRYLVSVQSAARALAAGKDLHLSKGVRELATWAATNIYSEGKP